MAANQHEVTRHARQVHNGPKPLACPYCEYKTADRSNFKKHVELHLKPRQFLCPLCKYAASKKCNLQYHIKSRHSGCNVPIDVSNVKLRVKKSSPESAEENTSKLDNASSIGEDVDMDDVEEDEGPDSAESSPINLSIKKNSKPSVAQPVHSNATDKAQKKSEVTSEKEKLLKVKEKVDVEKRVTTRQKKMEKGNENHKENLAMKDSPTLTPAVSTEKGKRRGKKQPAEKANVQKSAETAQAVMKDQPESLDQTETEKRDQERSEEEKAVRRRIEKQEEKTKPKKEKEQLKNERSTKENKDLNKPRKSGSKRSEKRTEQVEEAPQKLLSPEKPQKKVVKTKAVKRKAVEALDLSNKASPETSVPKAKRLKATTAEKLQIKPNGSEDANETKELSPAPQKDRKSNVTLPTPVKQTKTRNANKKTTTTTTETVAQAEDKTGSVSKNASSPHKISQRPSTDPQDASKELSNPTGNTNSDQNPAEKSPAQEDKSTPTVPEKTPTDTPAETVHVSPSCSSGEETPSPAEDHPPPTFAKPTSPPALVLPSRRSKPAADLEDDEGIHSSHEGGSDISDSASEGSDDSGLNSNGSGSGKMPNDPETPTEEIPTPTELKSHVCIFCDRTFPLEVQYRRHLNRHLVNVYYMDNTAKGQK